MAKVLGLNSGSSFDGIDVVVIEIEEGPDGLPARPKFIAGKSFDWPERVAERVLAAFENEVGIFEMCRLNYLAGAVFAECARSMMHDQDLKPGDVEVIGYDGQTIYQEPPVHADLEKVADIESILDRWLDGPYGCGFQIGEQSIIARFCETPTVTHFRPMDHALGGTGAPLMQYLDFVAFRDIGPVLTLNIGGIANCQLAHRDRSQMMAFDTGPGNVMMDHAMKKFFDKGYDRNGAVARSGSVDAAMLDELKNHDYFKRPVPRSAWRLDFGSSYADGMLGKYSTLSPQDLMATLTEFTAVAINHSIRDHVNILPDIREIIASGGGVFNSYLLERLRSYLPDHLELVTSDKYGIPPQFKEAVKFATLAHARVNLFANNIPAACGALEFGVLGKLVEPPRKARGTE